MKALGSLGVHLVLLGLGVLAAVWTWTRDEKPGGEGAGEIALFRIDGPGVGRVSFRSDKRSVVIEPNSDQTGRWFVVAVEKQKPKKGSPKAGDPHAGLTSSEAEPTGKEPDAGGDAGEVRKPQAETKGAETPQAEPEGVAEVEKKRFVGVTAAEKFFDLVSPLKAARAIGRIADDRKSEFGFDKPEGTLSLVVSGAEKTYDLGGEAPGGEFRYARDQASLESFAVPADIAQYLLYAENRLLERELHGFAPEDVTRVKLLKGDRQRELVPVHGKAEGWADALSKDALDETASNWMSKLGRLRISEYVEAPDPEPGPEHLVVRVEYFSGARSLGFLELVKTVGPEGKATYLARSEFTRWYAQVLSSIAEQIEQDLGSVVK